MREYKMTETKILTRLICNSCGKVIALRGGIPLEGVCAVRQSWGYESERDRIALICARHVMIALPGSLKSL